jgi:hypothetical protein
LYTSEQGESHAPARVSGSSPQDWEQGTEMQPMQRQEITPQQREEMQRRRQQQQQQQQQQQEEEEEDGTIKLGLGDFIFYR